MKKKSLLMLILSCAFCMVFSAIGVYAATFLKLKISGQINFIEYDKFVYIEEVQVKTFADGQTEPIKSEILPQYSGKYVKNQNNVVSVDLSELTVASGQNLQIEITMMSLCSNSDIFATVNNESVEGLSVSASSTLLQKNDGEKVSTGKASVVEILVSNTSTASVSLDTLSTSLTLSDISSFLSLLKTTTDSDGETYHYVEMGELSNGTKLHWRYMADSSGNAYKSTTKPTTLSGYYILETRGGGGSHCYLQNYTDTEIPYHIDGSGYEEIYAIDYALSDLRSYIKSTEYLDFLKITNSDIVYQMISPRKVSDLYKKIMTDGTDILETNTNYALSLTGITEQSDKFWIPSSEEIKNMLCGGTWIGGDAGWGTNEESTDGDCDSYWLRSPSVWDEGYLSYIDVYGDRDSGPYSVLGAALGSNFYIRPCFKI